jgi:hypothetical protein
VSSSATEIALGENLTLLNRYPLGRMLLAVIPAGGNTFFACFSFHLGSPRFLRGSHTSWLSCGVLGAQVKPKSEAKASTDDSKVFALPSGLHNSVIDVYDGAGNVIETHEHTGDFCEFYRRPSLERAYAFPRVRFAVASLLLLFRASPIEDRKIWAPLRS